MFNSFYHKRVVLKFFEGLWKGFINIWKIIKYLSETLLKKATKMTFSNRCNRSHRLVSIYLLNSLHILSHLSFRNKYHIPTLYMKVRLLGVKLHALGLTASKWRWELNSVLCDSKSSAHIHYTSDSQLWSHHAACLKL